MEANKLANALRNRRCHLPAGPDCLGCGYEHDCSIHGCRIIKMAADELERLQRIAMDPDAVSSAEKQACFRLGQMDMQQSVLLLLQNLALNVKGLSHGTLVDVANMIEDMLLEENTA